MSIFILDSFSLQNLAIDQVQRLQISKVSLDDVISLVEADDFVRYFFINPFLMQKVQNLLGTHVVNCTRPPILRDIDIFYVLNFEIDGDGLVYNFIKLEVRK